MIFLILPIFLIIDIDVGDLSERLSAAEIKSIPVNRKKRNDFKNFEKKSSFTNEKREWEDIPLDMNVKKNLKR